MHSTWWVVGVQYQGATLVMIPCGNPVASSHSPSSFLIPLPGLTLLSVLVAQECPLIDEILRQLDVKLLKSLMGE